MNEAEREDVLTSNKAFADEIEGLKDEILYYRYRLQKFLHQRKQKQSADCIERFCVDTLKLKELWKVDNGKS